MRKALIASAVSVVTSGIAFADIASSHNSMRIIPEFNWDGFYLGINAGYAGKRQFGKSYRTNKVIIFDKSKKGGFSGGGQIGYNYQFGHFVFGVEADMNYADLQNKKSKFFYDIHPHEDAEFISVVDSRIKWIGTLRARLGITCDRAFIYGTGGLAYASGDGSQLGTEAIIKSVYNYEEENGKRNRSGFTFGAGVEYPLSDNIIARFEGLYVNLGKEKRIAGTAPATLPVFYSKRKEAEFGIIRAGLNYKFN